MRRLLRLLWASRAPHLHDYTCETIHERLLRSERMQKIAPKAHVYRGNNGKQWLLQVSWVGPPTGAVTPRPYSRPCNILFRTLCGEGQLCLRMPRERLEAPTRPLAAARNANLDCNERKANQTRVFSIPSVYFPGHPRSLFASDSSLMWLVPRTHACHLSGAADILLGCCRGNR